MCVIDTSLLLENDPHQQHFTLIVANSKQIAYYSRSAYRLIFTHSTAWQLAFEIVYSFGWLVIIVSS